MLSNEARIYTVAAVSGLVTIFISNLRGYIASEKAVIEGWLVFMRLHNPSDPMFNYYITREEDRSRGVTAESCPGLPQSINSVRRPLCVCIFFDVCTTSRLHPPSYVASFCSPTECDATVHTSISSAIVYDEDLTIGVLAPWNFALCLAAALIRHERELFKAPSSITNDITFVPASSCPATNETACEWMRMSVCRTDVRWLLHFYRAVASAT